jgi:hypothetical protein
MIKTFCLETQKQRHHSEDLDVGWEDNIKMDLTELVSEIMDWIHLAQDQNQCQDLVNTVMNLRIP